MRNTGKYKEFKLIIKAFSKTENNKKLRSECETERRNQRNNKKNTSLI